MALSHLTRSSPSKVDKEEMEQPKSCQLCLPLLPTCRNLFRGGKNLDLLVTAISVVGRAYCNEQFAGPRATAATYQPLLAGSELCENI